MFFAMGADLDLRPQRHWNNHTQKQMTPNECGAQFNPKHSLCKSTFVGARGVSTFAGVRGVGAQVHIYALGKKIENISQM